MQVVIEGPSDEGAALAVLAFAGHRPSRPPHVTQGKSVLDARLLKYWKAAQREPWVVFRDTDGRCPVDLLKSLTATLPGENPRFVLRLADSETEAWLLGDPDRFGRVFGVSADRIPAEPETLSDAKRELLQLCRDSRLRDVRDDMVRVDKKTGALTMGPLYAYRLNDYAANSWRVGEAAQRCPSLRRALNAIENLPE